MTVALRLEEVLNPDNPSETVRDILLKKHPFKEASLVNPNTPVTDPHPIIFESIDSQLIRSTVLKMNGAAGPLGLDISAWKRMCTSFKSVSVELCDALAACSCQETQYLFCRPQWSVCVCSM